MGAYDEGQPLVVNFRSQKKTIKALLSFATSLKNSSMMTTTMNKAKMNSATWMMERMMKAKKIE